MNHPSKKIGENKRQPINMEELLDMEELSDQEAMAVVGGFGGSGDWIHKAGLIGMIGSGGWSEGQMMIGTGGWDNA